MAAVERGMRAAGKRGVSPLHGHHPSHHPDHPGHPGHHPGHFPRLRHPGYWPHHINSGFPNVQTSNQQFLLLVIVVLAKSILRSPIFSFVH